MNIFFFFNYSDVLCLHKNYSIREDSSPVCLSLVRQRVPFPYLRQLSQTQVTVTAYFAVGIFSAFIAQDSNYPKKETTNKISRKKISRKPIYLLIYAERCAKRVVSPNFSLCLITSPRTGPPSLLMGEVPPPELVPIPQESY